MPARSLSAPHPTTHRFMRWASCGLRTARYQVGLGPRSTCHRSLPTGNPVSSKEAPPPHRRPWWTIAAPICATSGRESRTPGEIGWTSNPVARRGHPFSSWSACVDWSNGVSLTSRWVSWSREPENIQTSNGSDDAASTTARMSLESTRQRFAIAHNSSRPTGSTRRFGTRCGRLNSRGVAVRRSERTRRSRRTSQSPRPRHHLGCAGTPSRRGRAACCATEPFPLPARR